MENADKITINEKIKFGPFQKCPYNKSILLWVFRLGMMIFGTVGLVFLNIWVAVIFLLYSVVIIFWVTPVIHCKYCYYSVKETIVDNKNGKTLEKLLPVDEWIETHLKKHIDCAKRSYPPINILQWLLPIVLITISFFLNFSLIALLSLIGFMGLLAIMLLYTKRKVCPTCAFVEECHASF